MQNKIQSLEVKNKDAKFKRKNKTQMLSLELNFSSFVYDDICLSLNAIRKFAFKLSQSLTCTHHCAYERRHAYEIKSIMPFKPSPVSDTSMAAYHSQDLVKALNFLYVASKLKQNVPSKQIITVPRSPFVYKKTREQFKLQKYRFKIQLILKPCTADFLLPMLGQLRVPGELKLRTRY